jgi:hypothetical protein
MDFTTLSLPQSIPIEVDSSTTLPYTTTHKYRIESRTAMADKMKKYIVGPMPARQFLDDFSPTKHMRHFREAGVRKFSAGCYDNTVKAVSEKQAYEPFVSPSKEIYFMFFHNYCYF